MPSGGHFLGFFKFFLENRRRGVARLLKLYKVFILTKKEGNNPSKILVTTSGPLRGCFLGEFFFEIFEISETLDMSSKQLGEMFKGDSADTCGGNFQLMSVGWVGGSHVRRLHQSERKVYLL